VSLFQLRNRYFQPEEDPFTLRFVSIFLGGSVINRYGLAQIVHQGSDWDGLGMMRTKKDILALLRDRWANFGALLGVDKEDGTETSVGNRILACGAVAFALVRTSAFYIASFCIIG